MLESGKTMYSSAMTYGMPVDLVRHSQNLRPIFGRYRYIVQGAKNFLINWNMPYYKSDIYYKPMENCTAEPSPGKPLMQSHKVDCPSKDYANTPKMMSFNSKGNFEDSKIDKEWKKLPFNEVFFHAVVTHEIRSSVNGEITAPFARINDGGMHIFGVKKVTRLQALRYVSRAANQTHTTYDKYFYKKVLELRIRNEEGSYIAIDGEPIQCSEYNVKVLPGFLNLMGKIVKE